MIITNSPYSEYIFTDGINAIALDKYHLYVSAGQVSVFKKHRHPITKKAFYACYFNTNGKGSTVIINPITKKKHRADCYLNSANKLFNELIKFCQNFKIKRIYCKIIIVESDGRAKTRLRVYRRIGWNHKNTIVDTEKISAHMYYDIPSTSENFDWDLWEQREFYNAKY